MALNSDNIEEIREPARSFAASYFCYKLLQTSNIAVNQAALTDKDHNISTLPLIRSDREQALVAIMLEKYSNKIS